MIYINKLRYVCVTIIYLEIYFETAFLSIQHFKHLKNSTFLALNLSFKFSILIQINVFVLMMLFVF